VARSTADSKGADNPELQPDMRNHAPARDLSARLSDLPESHPSSADYVSDDHTTRGPASSPERHQRDSPSEISPSADYAAPDEIQLTDDQRRTHILDGDETGGGHRHATGRPDKTEFPADWSDERIVDAILAVARNPDQAPERQDWNGRWLVSGRHDGVTIYAVVESDGRVWTAWPDEGSPGVTKNPAAKNSVEDT
jgi:hypothetical protein